MKFYLSLTVLLFVFFLTSSASAQSRRVVPDPNQTQKANKRPDQTAPSPTPPVEKEETNTTNIELIETNSESAGTDGETITVETDLVTVPVKISDRAGKFIGGLTKENFQVLENDALQEIAYFSNEQQPFTVALVLDMSYSTKFKIAEIQSAAIIFISQLRENDRVMVVSFDEQVHVLSPPTNDRQVLTRAIRSTKIGSGTSLYEAVDLVINQKLKNIKGRKAIVLFTDGVDTSSLRADNRGNVSDALELDAIIYPIKYDTFRDVQAMKNKPVVVPPSIPGTIPSQNKNPFPFPLPTSGVGTPSSQGTSPEDYRKAAEYLDEMASRTGGRIYEADSTGNLALAFSKIAAELREYYGLGYYPKEEAKPGKIRRIKVRVNQKGAVVRARDSYIIGEKVKSEK